MLSLSAFADEISPDPVIQLEVLSRCGIRFIEFRSIHKTNVLNLSAEARRDFLKLLKDRGFGLSAVGSPIGKVPIDAPFEEHLERFRRAIAIAQEFGTPNIRIFSYYPPKDQPFTGDWSSFRGEVLRRMEAKARLAESAGVRLLHENEHNIYGDSPDRVRDLIEQVPSPALRYAYDNANWIVSGYDPWEGWEKTKDATVHLHIKDWIKNESYGVLAGTGDGKIPETTADAVRRGYVGFAVMEPHLRLGGPTGGVTGADLFPVAVEAFRSVVARVGGVIA